MVEKNIKKKYLRENKHKAIEWMRKKNADVSQKH